MNFSFIYKNLINKHSLADLINNKKMRLRIYALLNNK